MRRLVIVLVVLAIARTTAAQPALTPPAAPPPPPAELPRKDEATATMLALGGTALGVMALYAGGRNESEGLLWLGIAGLAIGPSAGHIYAGENRHALGASLLRTGGMLMFGIGVLTLVSTEVDCIDGPCGDGNDGGAEAMLWVGGLTFAVTTLYDIIDASAAARRTNAKHARLWSVAPTVVPAASGPAPALSLIGRF